MWDGKETSRQGIVSIKAVRVRGNIESEKTKGRPELLEGKKPGKCDGRLGGE